MSQVSSLRKSREKWAALPEWRKNEIREAARIRAKKDYDRKKAIRKERSQIH